jgi:hypothetical protein
MRAGAWLVFGLVACGSQQTSGPAEAPAVTIEPTPATSATSEEVIGAPARPPDPAPKIGFESTGLRECDQYILALIRCTSRMPREARINVEQVARTMRDSLQSLPSGSHASTARRAMADACKQGHQAMASNPSCK